MFPEYLSEDNCWQTQQAKAHFSELVKKAMTDGDQYITYHGEKIAVLISKARYEALITPANSLLDFFAASPFPEIDLDMKRSQDTSRDLDL